MTVNVGLSSGFELIVDKSVAVVTALACIQSIALYLLLYRFTCESNYFLGALSLLWLAYLAMCYWVWQQARLSARHVHPQNPQQSHLLLWSLIMIFSALFRIMAIQAEPFLADDFERYLFDGRLQLAGINPYNALPIMYPELGGADIPRPEVRTIYPPAAEALFAFAAWLGGDFLHWRLLNLIPDLLGGWVFVCLLKKFRLSPLLLSLWLWNPLILKEGLHAAHLDIWTAFFVMLFIYFASLKKIKTAAFFLAIATLVKLLPLILLPAWWLKLRNKSQRISALLICSGIIISGFCFYFPAHPFGNIAVFLQHIQGYGALFAVLNHITQDQASELIKGLLIAFGGAWYWHSIVSLRVYQRGSEIRLLELFFVLFVFSSMGFPWYLLLVLPLALLSHNVFLGAFVGLTHVNFYAHQLHQSSLFISVLLLVIFFLAFFYQRKHALCLLKN